MRQKARKKSTFTKAKRAMLILLGEDLPSRSEIRNQQQKVEDCQEKAMSVMETLIDMYTAVGDQESIKKINKELEKLERECTSAKNRAQQYLDSRAHQESSGLSSYSSGKPTRRSMSKAKEDQIEQWRLGSAERGKHLEDLVKQTEAIKAGKTILDLRVIHEREEEILTGEALKCIENLGHSAGAYEASKNRLERKSGGLRRRLALYIEQLEGFRSIHYGNAKDLEQFADLLDAAIINLRESRQY